MPISEQPASLLLLDGKLRLYRRKDSPHWQCAANLGSRKWRATTREADFARARDVAADWYLTLKAKLAAGQIKPLRPFREAAAEFLAEYGILTRGDRNPNCVKGHAARIRLYLNPFFGSMAVDKITTGKIAEFRIWRRELAEQRYGKSAAWNTIENDIITLRMVLKLAERREWIDHLPQFAELFAPRRTVSYRGWFSAKEYFQLCQATWRYAQNPPKGVRKAVAQQLHDYVVFMANTGLRPDEASRLEFRDIVVDDEEWNEPILVIEVRGKRGFGYCKSMPSAVRAYARLFQRARDKGAEPLPTDRLFPLDHRTLLTRILVELGLKADSDGRPRSAYSLRHTYVCLRLLNGADIYQIAMNCRTSVEILEKFYAAHIANDIDTTRLNVGRAHERYE